MADIVSGGDGGHLGSAIAHTAERIGTFQRTQDRLDWERQQEVMRPKPTATKHPWILEAEREQAQKDAIRAEKIRTGRIVVDPVNGYTEKL